MLDQGLLDWLLDGDPSIQHQVRRDLLGLSGPKLSAIRSRILSKGWGARFLAARRPDGHWGRGYYQPKWTSTHYSLQDLRRLEPDPANKEIRESIAMLLRETDGPDGGVYYSPMLIRTKRPSDVCINGMVVDIAAYFRVLVPRLRKLVDLLLATRMADFGWNCEDYRGATHSSFHTTISVLEGLTEFSRADSEYRSAEIAEAIAEGAEFLLKHRLYKSHRTGEVVDQRMTKLSFPFRWRYDILRALDWLRYAGRPYDRRMDDALELLRSKRRKDGKWPLQCRHPGETHFEMEEVGKPSRWNTLRALRVLEKYSSPAKFLT